MLMPATGQSAPASLAAPGRRWPATGWLPWPLMRDQAAPLNRRYLRSGRILVLSSMADQRSGLRDLTAAAGGAVPGYLFALAPVIRGWDDPGF